MNATIKARWLNALRTGKYKQGRSVLRTEADEFCCLGVLCDILEPEAWEPAETASGRACFAIDTETFYLPLRVASEADVSAEQAFYLGRLNDNGDSFHKIADYIEQAL